MEIGGVIYMNIAFDLVPYDLDPRDAIAEHLGEAPADLCLLVRLRRGEAELVRRCRDEGAVEAWGRVSVMVARRRRQRRR